MVIGYDFEAENNPAITFCRRKEHTQNMKVQYNKKKTLGIRKK